MKTYIVNVKDINGNTKAITLKSENRYKASTSVLDMLNNKGIYIIAYHTTVL